MGVDCQIRLPGNVKVGYVSEVIGISAGLTAFMSPLSGCKGATHVTVPDVKVVGNLAIPTCCDIALTGRSIDGQVNHNVLYHMEPYGGGRLLMPRSTAFWISIGIRLVDFFGGSIDYQDCDDIDEDYAVEEKTDLMNCPEDGEEWQDLQNRIFSLKPIGKKELNRCDKLAAYKIEDMD